jgi:D-alanine-D-alanine ligase
VTTSKYDVFLNIFDGDDDNTAGLDLVLEMERLNLPFTGADSKFYDVTREQMQAAAEGAGINFAMGFNAKNEADLKLAHGLRFPLIVKHPNSYASEGLLPESRVSSVEELQAQFLRNQKEYGSARVEEFIEGREVTCLVVDNPEDLSAPFAYLPAEIKFPEGESFMHIEVKWFNWGTFIVPLEDAELISRVQAVAKEMYLAMQGTGYARVDMRIRPNGEIVVLEINPNCGILYYGPDDRGPADLPISWDKDGHYGFLDRICRSAILRQTLRRS